jgi:hypothetical protein
MAPPPPSPMNAHESDSSSPAPEALRPLRRSWSSEPACRAWWPHNLLERLGSGRHAAGSPRACRRARLRRCRRRRRAPLRPRSGMGLAGTQPAHSRLAEHAGFGAVRAAERGAGLVESPSQALRRHATGFAQQPPSMRVVGGTARLTDALQAKLVRTQVLWAPACAGWSHARTARSASSSSAADRSEPGGVVGDPGIAAQAAGLDHPLVTGAAG